MVSGQTILGRQDHLVIRDEDAVLFDTRKNTIIECNEVGFRILMLLDGTRPVSDIVATVCNEYEGDPAEIEAACIEFLHMSLADGLVFVGKAADA